MDVDKYDFGHKENHFFMEDIWSVRLMENPNYLEEIVLSEIVKDFWMKLQEEKIVPPILAVSESHCFAFSIFSSFRPKILFNFDSHNDLFQHDLQRITCENWALKILQSDPKLQFVWVAPSWIDQDEFEIPLELHQRVTYLKWDSFGDSLPEEFLNMIGHVCRSGAWMPPWLDDSFEQFLKESKAEIVLCKENPPSYRKFHVPTMEEREKYEMVCKSLRK